MHIKLYWWVYMGILEFLKKKQDKENEIDFADKKQEVEQKEKFVADLSFVELQGARWVDFAKTLKREGVLAPSYDTNPASIEYSIGKDNSPVVELTFQSKTSDSVRKVQLFKDKAYLYVNGAIEGFPETQRNMTLNKLWKDFQYGIRYINKLEINREEVFQTRRAAKTISLAERTKNKLEDLYQKEQEFLEENKDAEFDEFCYSVIIERDDKGFANYDSLYLPQFISFNETEDGRYVSEKPVIPFTPRTLEHCILHMTDSQKIESGEYLEEFEKKCRKLQKYSCFESDDWDKVIEFGKTHVRAKFQADILENGFGVN